MSKDSFPQRMIDQVLKNYKVYNDPLVIQELNKRHPEFQKAYYLKVVKKILNSLMLYDVEQYKEDDEGNFRWKKAGVILDVEVQFNSQIKDYTKIDNYFRAIKYPKIFRVHYPIQTNWIAEFIELYYALAKPQRQPVKQAVAGPNKFKASLSDHDARRAEFESSLAQRKTAQAKLVLKRLAKPKK